MAIGSIAICKSTQTTGAERFAFGGNLGSGIAIGYGTKVHGSFYGVAAGPSGLMVAYPLKTPGYKRFALGAFVPGVGPVCGGGPICQWGNTGWATCGMSASIYCKVESFRNNGLDPADCTSPLIGMSEWQITVQGEGTTTNGTWAPGGAIVIECLGYYVAPGYTAEPSYVITTSPTVTTCVNCLCGLTRPFSASFDVSVGLMWDGWFPRRRAINMYYTGSVPCGVSTARSLELAGASAGCNGYNRWLTTGTGTAWASYSEEPPT